METIKQLVDELSDIATSILDAEDEIEPLDAYKLAVQVKRNKIESERNQIFVKAFAVSEKLDAHPSALEAIAIQLGYDGKKASTIIDAIQNLKDE